MMTAPQGDQVTADPLQEGAEMGLISGAEMGRVSMADSAHRDAGALYIALTTAGEGRPD